MHADQIGALGQEPQAPSSPPAHDPYALATWAAARAAYPYHALVRIVDLNEGKQLITPIFPQPDCSDLALDGRTYVVGASDWFDKKLSAAELADVLRSFDNDAGPDPKRR